MQTERKTTLKSGDGADVSVGSTVYTHELEEIVVAGVEQWGLRGMLHFDEDGGFCMEADNVYTTKRAAAEATVEWARKQLTEAESRLASLANA